MKASIAARRCGRWQTAAVRVLHDIAARGRPAIVVGGTGLYFRALTHGLADVPPVPETSEVAPESTGDTAENVVVTIGVAVEGHATSGPKLRPRHIRT